MARSQRHLREFQHYDSAGYDHWRNVRPSWVPAGALAYFEFEDNRWWSEAAGTQHWSHFTTKTSGGQPKYYFLPDIKALLIPPMTVVLDLELGEDIDYSVRIMDWDTGTPEVPALGFELYFWDSQFNFFYLDNTPDVDLMVGATTTGRHRVAMGMSKLGADAKLSVSADGGPVQTGTTNLIHTPVTIHLRAMFPDTTYRPLSLTIYEHQLDAAFPGLSAL